MFDEATMMVMTENFEVEFARVHSLGVSVYPESDPEIDLDIEVFDPRWLELMLGVYYFRTADEERMFVFGGPPPSNRPFKFVVAITGIPHPDLDIKAITYHVDTGNRFFATIPTWTPGLTRTTLHLEGETLKWEVKTHAND